MRDNDGCWSGVRQPTDSRPQWVVVGALWLLSIICLCLRRVGRVVELCLRRRQVPAAAALMVAAVIAAVYSVALYKTATRVVSS